MALPTKGTSNGPKPSFGGNRGSAPGPKTVTGGAGFFDNIDFDNVDSSRRRIDEWGWYEAEIESAVPGTSSGGHPQLDITFKLTDEKYPGFKIRYWLVVTANSAFKVKQFGEALGFEGGNLRGVAPSDLAGLPIKIKIGPNPVKSDNDGNPYPQVDDFTVSDSQAA
jgi:hypothetical protein